MPTFTLLVNGTEQTVDADPQMPLLWVLRDLLQLTGTKYGCGVGACGACTVLLDGTAVRACTMPVAQAVGQQVLTIEGLIEHPLQSAWQAESVSQCGYCQPGQIMAAAALLAQHPHPGEAEIEAAFDGMLCRCGTYLRIKRAVQRAAGVT